MLARDSVFFCGTDSGLFVWWDGLDGAMNLIGRIMFELRGNPIYQRAHLLLAGLQVQAVHLCAIHDRGIDRQRIPVSYSPNMSLDKLQFDVGKFLLEDNGPDVLCFAQVPPRRIPPPDRLPS